MAAGPDLSVAAAPVDAQAALALALPKGDRAAAHVGHVRALYVQAPATLAGNAIGIALIAIIFWKLASPFQVMGWLAVAALLWVLRLAHHLRFVRSPDASDERILAWRHSWKALVLAQGAMWGLAVWLFWGQGTPYHQVALLLIVYTYCLGSVQLLASQMRVFFGFASLVLVPAILRVATDASQPWHWPLAGILSLLFVLAILMGRTQRAALDQAIWLKGRTEKLAAQLQLEKAEAERARAAEEDARRAAEAASRAKTQFFAAASHDLRQPLHAMGLFAEALRQRIKDPEVASLVNSINESVDALEGLFGELLDITRIDTGGVEAQPEPVRLKELFARLRLHFEPTAFEKGLALSFHGEQRVAHADPVLLERVLRNLVSNAIRYSDDGGVLVAARPRGGKLLLQVWDSGIGISEQSLPRIFDEFFQAQSNRPLAAHQRKGLGLGLAIVKRLVGLMDSRIEVRSQVGRGTVFSFEVPMGRAARSLEAAPSGGRGGLGVSLQGQQVLVLEDEVAVREGLVVLLQAWGAQVLAFDSLAPLQAWLAQPEKAAPNLLLVDYRLPEGANGVQALGLIRERFAGQRLPAIVITGSTMGGHEMEAEANDFHLLIKPVLPAKLRAMIAFKLGLKPA
jgi:two-component system, sensor histidine kinase